MKTCTYCGRENADDAAHCSECGTPFVTASTEPKICMEDHPQVSRRAVAESRMLVGALWFIGGVLVTAFSYSSAANNPAGGSYIIAYGAIIFGVIKFIQGYASNDSQSSDDDIAYAALSHGTRLEAEGRVKQALAVYQAIIEKYPDSEAGRDARKSIDALRDSPSLFLPD